MLILRAFLLYVLGPCVIALGVGYWLGSLMLPEAAMLLTVLLTTPLYIWGVAQFFKEWYRAYR